MELAYKVIVQVVFWSTVLSFLLAIVDRWAGKWFPVAYPASRYFTPVRAIGDLCDQIGNLFKEKIAPRIWQGDDRRS